MINKIYEKIKKIIKENKGFIIFMILLLVFTNYKLPYIVYKPGGYINLNNRMEIEDQNEVNGSFNMAYVSVLRGTPFTYILSYMIPNWDLEKTADITLENQSYEELEDIQKLNMDSSLDVATIIAYQQAGEKITDINSVMNIMYINEKSETELKLGDKILKIENIEYPTTLELITVLDEKRLGDSITMLIERDGEVLEAESKFVEIDGEKKIGMMFVQTYDYKIERKIDFETKEGESGPSGGMMLTLSIYNYLVEEDITKGRKIVGTGTINISGSVGRIDGIKYKLLGSKDADIFLCSKENEEEAKEVIEEFDLDIKLISVETIEEAISELKK